VVFDSNRIKDYVFATGRLKEIRGASIRVTALTRESAIEDLVEDGTVIYADGAAGMVEFESEAAADEFRRRLERRYRLGTISGSLSSACVELADDFQEAVERAMAGLRRAKEDRRERQQLVDSPYMRFCESCRHYPVETRYDERYLCRSCTLKRRTFDESAEGARGRFLSDDPLGVGEEIVRRTDHRDWTRATFPRDLSELGTLSRPENYLAFIYCDGNQMGTHLREMADQDQDAYAAFSRQVSESIRKAAVSALSDYFPDPQPVAGGRLVAPFEVLVIGGDDLILVSVADRAVELALALCQRFQAETRERGNEMSMSAGVVLAHVGQPILSLELRSRELLRRAKDHAIKVSRTRQQVGAPPDVGAIDFLVVTDPTLNPIQQVRHQQYWGDEERLWRTQRPYTLERLSMMVEHIRRFKGGLEGESFPRNKLNSLYQALFKSKSQATFETLVVTWRLSRSQREKLLSFAADFDFLSELPWGYDDAEHWHSTALADLVELYDFVGSEDPQGGTNDTN
jgi:hypothetical protein